MTRPMTEALIDSHDAALFDLDGVITPTAEVHMRAWATMFEQFLSSRGVEAPYTEADYFEHVDGRPRYDGVRAVLASRGLELPEGEDSDPGDQPQGEETVRGLGNRKNDEVLELLREEGVAPYPGTVAYLGTPAERATPARSTWLATAPSTGSTPRSWRRAIPATT